MHRPINPAPAPAVASSIGTGAGSLIPNNPEGSSQYPLIGYVREIQGGAAGQFALLEDRRGLDLVPGMNVTVHIHKR
jgi:hypothetical protein